MLEMATKLAALVATLVKDVEKLEERSVDMNQLKDVSRRIQELREALSSHNKVDEAAHTALHKYAEGCAEKAELRCAKVLEQRVRDLGLDKFSALDTRVAKVETDVDTFKKIAIKNGVYGGLITLGTATGLGIVFYVIRGLSTGDWSLPG